MATLTYTVGLPGSGKSTWAREQLGNGNTTVRVNRDDLRAMLRGTVDAPRGHFSKAIEKMVAKLRDTIIIDALSRGLDVICDDTNFHTQTHLYDIVHSVAKASIVRNDSFLQVPLAECIRRDENRTNPVGASVIRKMWQDNIQDTLPSPSVPDLPSAVICDLDGTLAILDDRDPYDASSCHRDKANKNVLAFLKAFKEGGHEICFVSGRQYKDLAPTNEFLRETCGFKDGEYRIWMRPTGDTRPDEIVKKEIYDNYISKIVNVSLVVDDRDKVVDMWRGLGLQTWQVNFGNF